MAEACPLAMVLRSKGKQLSKMKKEFEFFPEPLEMEVGAIKIHTLPDLKSKVDQLGKCGGVENGWVYAPPQQTMDIMTGKIRTSPYCSRVFGLQKTHANRTRYRDGGTSGFPRMVVVFFSGNETDDNKEGLFRLYSSETSTTLRLCVDFPGSGAGIQMAENFWKENKGGPHNAKLLVAAIHALFLGQNRLALEFEKFNFLYTATDACYKLTKTLKGLNRHLTHPQRIEWMCGKLGVLTPGWAKYKGGSTVVSNLRGNAVHEALFGDEPLGFAVLEGPNVENLILEMTNLVCRLLVALLGGQDDPYVKTPVDTRNVHDLRLG